MQGGAVLEIGMESEGVGQHHCKAMHPSYGPTGQGKCRRRGSRSSCGVRAREEEEKEIAEVWGSKVLEVEPGLGGVGGLVWVLDPGRGGKCGEECLLFAWYGRLQGPAHDTFLGVGCECWYNLLLIFVTPDRLGILDQVRCHAVLHAIDSLVLLVGVMSIPRSNKIALLIALLLDPLYF